MTWTFSTQYIPDAPVWTGVDTVVGFGQFYYFTAISQWGALSAIHGRDITILLRDILFIVAILHSILSLSQTINDEERILTENQRRILNEKAEKIKKATSLEFIISIGRTKESKYVDDNQVYLTLLTSSNQMEIEVGEMVIQEVGIGKIHEINRLYIEPLLAEKNFFAAFEKGLNHITHRWLEDYLEPKRTKRKATIAITIFMVVFMAILFRMSRAFKPLVDEQKRQFERMKKEEKLSGKSKWWW